MTVEVEDIDPCTASGEEESGNTANFLRLVDIDPGWVGDPKIRPAGGAALD